MPLAQPRFSPSFRIGREELIFTVGSCFARNIENQLILEGYNVAAKQFRPPEDTGFKAGPDALLNRYLVHSIANELRWGLGHGKPFRQRYYAQMGPDKWFDPHMNPAITPAPLEVVEARREAVRRYMALAAQARVVIMTLGMAEAWFDRKNGLYLNGVLPPRAREREPERFEFHILDYPQILESLEFIHALLTARGAPGFRMMVTVSPVAINTTFTGEEILVANSYSKSVQRAAVEAFVRRHPNVDYFPSYESVTLSDRKRAWRADQAHASDEIVRLNVLRMIEAYASHPEDETGAGATATSAAAAFALVQEAKDAAARGDDESAMRLFAKAAAAAPGEGLILLDYGRFLHAQGRFTDAAKVIKASIRNGSGAYGGYYQYAVTLRAAGRYPEAFTAARLARNIQPTRRACCTSAPTWPTGSAGTMRPWPWPRSAWRSSRNRPPSSATWRCCGASSTSGRGWRG
ncbi:MAG: GSCFA domain-containing protein [Caulobacteraceae bacterium]